MIVDASDASYQATRPPLRSSGSQSAALADAAIAHEAKSAADPLNMMLSPSRLS